MTELARVLKPAGRLLLRSNFSDHIPPSGWWLEHFPRGFEADAALFQPLHEVIAPPDRATLLTLERGQ